VIDVVLQVGPALEPPEAGRIPFVLLCDWNMALSIRFRDNPYSSCHGMRMEEAREINERHADVYARAAAILTLSDKLRESFVVDYQIPRDRLLTVHAGPNLDAARIPPREPTRDPGRPPTVLFCGKEFHRKGGDLLLEAFRGVRCELPSARLVMMGPREAGVHAPGVEIAGFLDKNDPGQLARLARHYAEADVFCLPTRLDPFPSVVREAMAFGLPCVTSDVWAVPEMVVDGETGFTVPVDNAPLLAERLLRILRDPELGRRMGEAAQRRAGRLFTWPATALRIHERLLAVVAQRRG
jgi:glycosyltransferase involved in cell wall biosynthesis